MTETGLSFEEALRESEELLLDLEENGHSAQAQAKLDEMLKHLASCRGFFVYFLTGDSPFADQAPDFLLRSLEASEHVPDLLAKNLVMSVTMQITHERAKDLHKAQGSAQVAKRSAQLIKSLNSSELRNKLVEMRSSIKMKAGVYADFLKRWNYDDEQLAAAKSAIETLL